MPIMEDEHGTYIMNSKDLRAVEHVGKLAAMGIDSLKIEGRTKSHYYVARTAQIYRRAIDDAVAGKPFNPELLLELEGLSNRGYTGGLMERRPAQDYQNYITGHSESHRSQFVGEVLHAWFEPHRDPLLYHRGKYRRLQQLLTGIDRGVRVRANERQWCEAQRRRFRF